MGLGFISGFSNVMSTMYSIGYSTLNFSKPFTLSTTDIHIHVSDGFNDTNEIGFHKSPKNYMVHQARTSCATVAHLFFPPKINIVVSENGHESLWVNPSQSI